MYTKSGVAVDSPSPMDHPRVRRLMEISTSEWACVLSATLESLVSSRPACKKRPKTRLLSHQMRRETASLRIDISMHHVQESLRARCLALSR